MWVVEGKQVAEGLGGTWDMIPLQPSVNTRYSTLKVARHFIQNDFITCKYPNAKPSRVFIFKSGNLIKWPHDSVISYH